MKSSEIFSGAGGLAKGLELAGFEHDVFFVECNRHAGNSWRLNVEMEKVFQGDIKDDDFSSLQGIDIVTAGPPCQLFSPAGKYKADNDTCDMFPVAIKAIETLHSKELKKRCYLRGNR